MRRFTALAVLILVAHGWFQTPPSRAQAQSDADAMEAANGLYQEGRYPEAIRLYERLVARGVRESVLFYNLGNAYYKQGDLGRAILNYRRAQRLAPRDDDLRTNLALARSQTADRLGSMGEVFAIQAARFVYTWLSVDELAVVSLALGVLTVGSLLAFSHLRPSRLRSTVRSVFVVALSTLALCGFVLGTRVVRENARPEAVIVAEALHALSGPGPQYLAEFTLHSGAEVVLLEERDGWMRLALPGRRLQGWVPEDAVARIAIPEGEVVTSSP